MGYLHHTISCQSIRNYCRGEAEKLWGAEIRDDHSKTVYCFLGMRGLLNTWIHWSCGRMHKIYKTQVRQSLYGHGRESQSSMPEELLAVDGSWGLPLPVSPFLYCPSTKSRKPHYSVLQPNLLLPKSREPHNHELNILKLWPKINIPSLFMLGILVTVMQCKLIHAWNWII